MALEERSVLRRLILAWDDDGAFVGGHADWADLAVDTRTGEVRLRQDREGEPIAGSLQSGTPVADVLSATEVQRARSLQRATEARDAVLAERDGARNKHRAVATALRALREKHGDDPNPRPGEELSPADVIPPVR